MTKNINACKENIATGIVKPKTTALFFDKLWIPEGYENYDINCNIPKEIRFRINKPLPMDNEDILITDSFYSNPLPFIERDMYDLSKIKKLENFKEYKGKRFFSSKSRNSGLSKVVFTFKKYFNIDIIPIYLSPTQFDIDFNEKKTRINNIENPVVIICTEQIPSILEEKLEWEQVLEFRCDKKAVEKLFRFRNWVNIELLDCKREVIISKFELALDEYKNALKKHGIETIAGGFSTVLTSSAMILENIGEGINVQSSVGFSIAAGLTVFTVEKYLSYKETRNNPIAYIYDVFKLVK